MNAGPVIRYYPDTGTMAIELRPWPEGGPEGRSVNSAEIGGQDAGEDLVIHYAADGEARLREIERASRHPEHIAAALMQMRQRVTETA
jgi:hypothetical protein